MPLRAQPSIVGRFMRSLSFLLTNDDGIDSPALAALATALQACGRVQIVAPATEQSWIGKAISRRRRLTARPRDDLFDCPAWDVDGTPADCVNLGLGHLVRGRIDAVVSGINMGSNASLPLILCSGTVGGALEGSFHGLHAVASSIRIARSDFGAARDPRHPDHGKITQAIEATAQLTAQQAVTIARRRQPGRCIVHNFNFPPDATPDTIIERTVPAHVRTGTLFQPANEPGVFEFSFAMGNELPAARLTDRISLESGRANHSVLDFGRLGVPGGIFGSVPRSAGTPDKSS